jgi:hypothetical protein
MGRVGYADERHTVLVPPVCEITCVFRTDRDYLSAAIHKLLIVQAQLRHVPAAIWSEEPPIENQNNVLFAPKVSELDCTTLRVLSRDVRSHKPFFCLDYNHPPHTMFLSLRRCRRIV